LPNEITFWRLLRARLQITISLSVDLLLL